MESYLFQNFGSVKPTKLYVFSRISASIRIGKGSFHYGTIKKYSKKNSVHCDTCIWRHFKGTRRNTRALMDDSFRVLSVYPLVSGKSHLSGHEETLEPTFSVHC